MEVPESLSLPRKAVPLGKVAANAVSRRKGYLQLSSQAQSRKGYVHTFSQKAGLRAGQSSALCEKMGLPLAKRRQTRYSITTVYHFSMVK